MLPKCSLVSGAWLDTWASKGIEGASIVGFTIAWASREGIEGASTLGFTIALASMGSIDGHRPLFILRLEGRPARVFPRVEASRGHRGEHRGASAPGFPKLRHCGRASKAIKGVARAIKKQTSNVMHQPSGLTHTGSGGT